MSRLTVPQVQYVTLISFRAFLTQGEANQAFRTVTDDETLVKLQNRFTLYLNIPPSLLNILVLECGEETQWESVLMNYSSPLQMIIPESP